MKIVQFQVIDTDEKTSDSLVIQLPNEPSTKFLTLELMSEEFEKFIKSFVKAAKLTYEMEGDCIE